MGTRWAIGVLAMGMIGAFVGTPAVWAADGDAAEAAQPAVSDTSREEVLQNIEATRQTDPELAQEMEHQLNLLDAGQAGPQPEVTENTPGAATQVPGTRGVALPLGAGQPGAAREGGVQGGAPNNSQAGGPPVEGDAQGHQDGRFQQVQEDPRMQDVRRQYESGEINEAQARERVFEVLKEHGIEPANGREWEHGSEGSREGGLPEGGLREGAGLERGEGFERAMMEHMAPEAREQMERFSEHQGESRGSEREMRERESQTLEHQSEAPAHEYEAAQHEAPQHESEAPQHEYEASQHDAPEYDAPQHEGQPPEPEQHEQPEQYEHQPPPQP